MDYKIFVFINTTVTYLNKHTLIHNPCTSTDVDELKFPAAPAPLADHLSKECFTLSKEDPLIPPPSHHWDILSSRQQKPVEGKR